MKTMAGSPFDEGDIILASHDKMAFKVHKLVLTLASPCFKTMFTLPQPASSPDCTEGLPVIPLEEAGEILEVLLHFCYPIKEPKLTTVFEVGEVLKAAMKYEIQKVTDAASKQLLDFINTEPLLVFSIACTHKYERHARAAARAWKSRQTPAREDQAVWNNTIAAAAYTCPSMKDISAGSFFRLLEYARTGTSAAFCTPFAYVETTRENPSKISERISFYSAWWHRPSWICLLSTWTMGRRSSKSR
ncbi:hypothetical protein NM688_g6232 [Phlebia brevispora]|uniref:Uncharacterized protein n=1 Tax=Phlebia brevispora TaxID=194682 RepID=A0ACC1SIN4_9APHY|nr:hypothetical protein NM688_g6232 [Phlebia brevispora]